MGKEIITRWETKNGKKTDLWAGLIYPILLFSGVLTFIWIDTLISKIILSFWFLFFLLDYFNSDFIRKKRVFVK